MTLSATGDSTFAEVNGKQAHTSDRPCVPRQSLLSFLCSRSRSCSQAHLRAQRDAPQPLKCVRQQLRELLRETAQPVAVVTSFMPASSSGKQEHEHAAYHGATLSSFTSIAMDPYPLVTFALRVPSRMATTLNSFFPPASSTSPLNSNIPPASTPSAQTPPSTGAHMVINLLDASQSKHAHAFSRPDLFPAPFSDPDIQYTLSEEGLPVLEGALGAMSCRLVRKGIPLWDLDYLSSTSLGSDSAFGEERDTILGHESSGGGVTSELFIAQVTRIESLGFDPNASSEADGMLPLLYHRRRYTSCMSSREDS